MLTALTAVRPLTWLVEPASTSWGSPRPVETALGVGWFSLRCCSPFEVMTAVEAGGGIGLVLTGV